MTTRRTVLAAGAGIGVAAASSGVAPAQTAQTPQTGQKTFVLVHGAWHGGWAFESVVPLLERAGHTVHALTLTGLRLIYERNTA